MASLPRGLHDFAEEAFGLAAPAMSDTSWTDLQIVIADDQFCPPVEAKSESDGASSGALIDVSTRIAIGVIP